ncbi:MAG: bifunctional folylpolyglutamate synthase/dihydrofolate synthase [Clostridia bacterium]|nr:bifunctional folylpolyglutamate synthase/dihydrofolate synthase [Clostridia bacterium]
MDYKDVTAFINKAKKFGSRLDLTRIAKLCELLGNPQDKCNFVHVAGTNGKGSTSVFIENILIEAGYKTGLYTSPFIYDFNERIQINNIPISDKALISVMERVVLATEEMIEDGFEHPTEFELITAAAFCYFADEECDVVVLEVGLGGILDATNVIGKPLVSVITSISYDHTEYLGETISEIAKNKCGIIKQGCDTVSYPFQKEEALEVIKQESDRLSSNLTISDTSSLEIKKIDLCGNEFNYRNENYKTSLLGEYQIYNAITAINTAEILQKNGYKISEKCIKNGIKNAKWQARFEVLNSNPTIIADGSHNADGMKAFVLSAKKLLLGKKVICVFGMLKDKDYSESLKLLSEIADTVIVTEVDNPRFETAENLKKAAQMFFKDVYSETDNFVAMKKAAEIAKDDDIIIALGSLYMMKNIKDAVNELKKDI